MVVIPMRFVFTVLGFFGVVFIFALKTNLSIAVVSMVNQTALEVRRNRNRGSRNESEFHLITLLDGDVDPTVKDGPMMWAPVLQGIIVSSYFWGYFFGQLPGARLAEDLSAKWTFYGGVSTHIVGALLTPLATYIHFSVVIVLRVIQGVAGGFTHPAMHSLLAKWAPPHERSTITSCIYNGSAIGTVLSLLLTGAIAHYVNWEASFYILGGLGVPWMALWPILISDSPLKHRLIQEKELKYLTSALNLLPDNKKKVVQWKAIFTNRPVWVLIISHAAFAWGWYICLTQLPLYMNMVLKFKMDANGAVTALPFFCMFLFSIAYGKFADFLAKKEKLSITNIRKLSTVISSGIPAICCFVIPFVTDRILAVGLITVQMTFLGGVYSGFLQVHIDLASNFAGTLISITNSFATAIGISVPIFVGWVIDRDPSIASWRLIFWISTGFYLIQAVIFSIFGTSKEQKFNHPPTEHDTTELE